MAEMGGLRSFDNLVGAGEDRRWHGEAQCRGGLKIDNQPEDRRLLDRQIGRLGTLQNLSRVNPSLARESVGVSAITDQTASCDKLREPIERRNGITRGQCRELVGPGNAEYQSSESVNTGLRLNLSAREPRAMCRSRARQNLAMKAPSPGKPKKELVWNRSSAVPARMRMSEGATTFLVQ
jgi:hypothetical protein